MKVVPQVTEKDIQLVKLYEWWDCSTGKRDDVHQIRSDAKHPGEKEQVARFQMALNVT